MNFGFDESVCLLSGLAMISTLVIPGADVRQRMIGLVGGVGLVGYSFYVANQTSGVIVLPIPLLALGWALPGKAIYDHFKSRFRPGDTQMGGGLAPAKPLPNTRGHETPSDSTPAFYQFRGHMMIADPAGETVEGKGTLEFGAAGVQGTFRKQLVAVAWDQVAEIDFREDSDNAAELMIFPHVQRSRRSTRHRLERGDEITTLGYRWRQALAEAGETSRQRHASRILMSAHRTVKDHIARCPKSSAGSQMAAGFAPESEKIAAPIIERGLRRVTVPRFMLLPDVLTLAWQPPARAALPTDRTQERPSRPHPRPPKVAASSGQRDGHSPPPRREPASTPGPRLTSPTLLLQRGPVSLPWAAPGPSQRPLRARVTQPLGRQRMGRRGTLIARGGLDATYCTGLTTAAAANSQGNSLTVLAGGGAQLRPAQTRAIPRSSPPIKAALGVVP